MSYDPKFSNVSLLLHMDGDNNSTTFLDASLSPKIITAYGGAKVSTVQSKFGGASAYFDTTALTSVVVPYSAAFDFGAGDFTIECFVYRTGNNPNTGRIWSANGDFFIQVDLTVGADGVLNVAMSSTGTNWNLVSGPVGTALTLNQWVHIAVVRNGGTAYAFINGARYTLSTSLGATALVNNGTNGVTARSIGGQANGTNRSFVGHIDEFRVTKGVARYTTTFTPPTRAFDDRGPRFVGKVRDRTGALASRTVRAYRRDTGALLGSAVPRDTTGDQWRRFVSLMLHADGANNSTTFTDTSPTPKTVTVNGNTKISTAQSEFGGSSMLFDGTGDYLNVAYDTSIDLISPVCAFTIECWVYASSLNSAGSRIAATGGGGVTWNSTNGIHVLFQVSGGKLNAQVSNNTASPLSASTAASVTTGAWTHVALCYSPSAAKIYLAINGTVEEFAVGSPARPSTNPALQIGTIPGEAAASPYAWNGYIDDLRITKGIARYTANFTPPTAPHPDYDNSAALDEYVIETPGYTGEAQVVCLDDAADILENDLIHRAFPKHKYSLNVGAFELRVNGEPILFS